MPSPRMSTRSLGLVLVTLSLVTGLSGGCAHKVVHAAVPVATPPSADVRPMTVAPDTDASPPLEAANATPPSIPASSENTTVDLASSPVAPPPRTRTTVPAQSEENAEQDNASKPQPPRIAPQLSPGDQAAYQRRIEDDSNVANRNLQSITGMQLNATQQDLADKVRSFLAQATDAGKNGDWTRAQNLAQKARVLSVELINSL